VKVLKGSLHIDKVLSLREREREFSSYVYSVITFFSLHRIYNINITLRKRGSILNYFEW